MIVYSTMACCKVYYNMIKLLQGGIYGINISEIYER